VTIGGDLVAGSKIVGYTPEQVSTLLAQISAIFQPQPFDGRCPYLGSDVNLTIDGVIPLIESGGASRRRST
jgi:hypothetical protein